MGCRYCNKDKIESQEHLEMCTGTIDLRVNHGMNIPKEHLICWRRMSKRLKYIEQSEATEEMKDKWLQRKNAKKPVTNKQTNKN